MKYDYGDPNRGFGFEHCNFFESLRRMGHDIVYFDFLTLMDKYGRDEMNRRLIEVARSEKPDVMFTVLYEEQLCREAVRSISESGTTQTVNWFCDDHWRFESFSQHWAPCFNWVISTSASALPKYERIGYANVIKSQYACNHFSYHKLDLPKKYDVTFVGQPHSNRRLIVESLRERGFNVNAWGHGWETGRLTQEEMIEVFNQSRINLNLTKTSSRGHVDPAEQPLEPWGGRFKQAAFQSSKRVLNHVPFGRQFKGLVKQAIGWDAASPSGVATAVQPEVQWDTFPDQIKGRNFEIPACGGFALTGLAENLEDYYSLGSEVVCYGDVDDMASVIQEYLEDDDKREAIAQAGYRRTLSEHTYVHRFAEIFRQMGLGDTDVAAAVAGKVAAGQVEEIQ